MMELNKLELQRQDHVDNLIFNLVKDLNPANGNIDWNIEMIGEIRDSIRTWVVDRLNLCSDNEFYP